MPFNNKKKDKTMQKFNCSYVKSDGRVGTLKVEASSISEASSKLEEFVKAMYKKYNADFDASTIVSMTIHLATKSGRPTKTKKQK